MFILAYPSHKLIRVELACFRHIFIEAAVKSTRSSEQEPSEHLSYPNQHEQDGILSLSSQKAMDPTYSRLSKSNENLTQSTSQKNSSSSEQQRGERITKSEDRHPLAPAITPLNDMQIQRCSLLKEKFDSQTD